MTFIAISLFFDEMVMPRFYLFATRTQGSMRAYTVCKDEVRKQLTIAVIDRPTVKPLELTEIDMEEVAHLLFKAPHFVAAAAFFRALLDCEPKYNECIKPSVADILGTISKGDDAYSLGDETIVSEIDLVTATDVEIRNPTFRLVKFSVPSDLIKRPKPPSSIDEDMVMADVEDPNEQLVQTHSNTDASVESATESNDHSEVSQPSAADSMDTDVTVADTDTDWEPKYAILEKIEQTHGHKGLCLDGWREPVTKKPRKKSSAGPMVSYYRDNKSEFLQSWNVIEPYVTRKVAAKKAKFMSTWGDVHADILKRHPDAAGVKKGFILALLLANGLGPSREYPDNETEFKFKFMV
jgi:hypothetical protein